MQLDLKKINRTLIMGILNVTPDSFADGGKYSIAGKAVEHALQMVKEGADIIDVGGESTRPGASPVSLQEELDRVIPVISKLRTVISVPISIDTYKPAVMQAAIQAGASMINDTHALQHAGALEVALENNVTVCLMHMQGEPASMQQQPQYKNVVTDIFNFLQERITACLAAGIDKDKIIIDPGFGFGKTIKHNLQLLKQLQKFNELNCPVLLGVSRKSTLGALLNKPVEERLSGSIAAAVYALQHRVKILRVHDVAATKDAITIFEAIENVDCSV